MNATVVATALLCLMMASAALGAPKKVPPADIDGKLVNLMVGNKCYEVRPTQQLATVDVKVHISHPGSGPTVFHQIFVKQKDDKTITELTGFKNGFFYVTGASDLMESGGTVSFANFQAEGVYWKPGPKSVGTPQEGSIQEKKNSRFFTTLFDEVRLKLDDVAKKDTDEIVKVDCPTTSDYATPTKLAITLH